MTNAMETRGVLYSSLGNDPELGELVEMFVDEMPGRVDRFEKLFAEKNWEELRRAAHQLKGAVGSYGFDVITPKAAQLEEAVKQRRPESEIQRVVEELCAMCRSTRAGAPG